jgi:transaldolase/glucose-6-phosphate isomerase
MQEHAVRDKRRGAGEGRPGAAQDFSLGKYRARIDARLAAWDAAEFAPRLWRKDATLWSAEPVPELENRVDWLDLPASMAERLDGFADFARELGADKIDHAVLLGMGGSSLAPEVFAATLGRKPGSPELIVLDSTHPRQIEQVAARIALPRTVFIVASKSGTTIEPLSLFHFFWERVSRETSQPGRHFVAITDPGTPLERLAGERGFRRCFAAPPNVGGRYSALTDFGLVPAAVIGADPAALLGAAARMAQASGADRPASANPALRLGAALGELALAGRDKVTFLTSAGLAAFPSWIEQLIAESTGKTGKGILPVTDEPPAAPETYGDDRVFVALALRDEGRALDPALERLEAAGHPVIRIRLQNPPALGGEMLRWEIAVAAAGAVLGIHPFNQPDVELAKDLARAAMRSGAASEEIKGNGSAAAVPSSDGGALAARLSEWLAKAEPGRFIALQAFLATEPETLAALEALRLRLRDRLRLATTLGFGPRFLHSTGQYHKGGPNTGLFLQLIDDAADALPVPGSDYSFGALIRAQALGDYRALEQRGRTVLRIRLAGEPRQALAAVAAALAEAGTRAAR